MYYYDIKEDLQAFPDAWCMVLIGGRNIGKTYSTLKHYLQEDIPIAFVKRTNEDVDLLCAGNQLGKKGAEFSADFSPYKAVNRDTGETVKAFKIRNGIGAFYRTNEDGSAYGMPCSYLVSLHAVSKVKGFDLSECKAVVFDEFVPQPWERVNRKEGEQLMDLYKTVARDSLERTGEELKLILLANAVNVYNPTCEILELTDIIAEMDMIGTELVYLEERGILIRLLQTPDAMMEEERRSGLYQSMARTAWGRMAFGNTFAYNDFSKVKKQALKGYRPLCAVELKEKTWYLYIKEDIYYMCRSRNRVEEVYDLNEESEQKRFYYDFVIELQNATIEKRISFETYGMYDLIMNYKKRFTI